MRYPDSRTEEYVNFMGGPKDDGWEIIPKGKSEIYLPGSLPPVRLLEAEVDLATIPMMSVGVYRYNGRRRMAENVFGATVQFRIFEWEGER